jgi:hypothetical protein
MTKIQLIEREIKKLDNADLAVLADWFQEYSWKEWDRQIARDSQNGKLDKLAKMALAETKAGKTREL